MCFVMGNVIRLFKIKINSFDINDFEDEIKEEFLEWIDIMINECIKLVEYLIVRNVVWLIEEGEKVFIYGWYRLVEKMLLKVKEIGKMFDVIIIDDLYECGG